MTHHVQPVCLDSQTLQPLGGRKPIRRSARRFDLERLEDRIVPAITINNGSFDYESIAAAVSAASANDTIHITTIDMPSGGYVGSATIDKSLTIVGTPDGSGNRPILKAPTDTSASNNAILYFTGSTTTVTMSNLTITGTGDALDDFTAGIWVDDDATLNFSAGDITAINSSFGTTALPGGSWTTDWVGTGIVVGNTSTGGTAYLDNITIEEYQLFGVYALHADSYVALINSTVTGRGPIEQAQYGVRIAGGAIALIDDNTITINQYDGMYYNIGISLGDAGVGTIITNNQLNAAINGIQSFLASPAAGRDRGIVLATDRARLSRLRTELIRHRDIDLGQFVERQTNGVLATPWRPVGNNQVIADLNSNYNSMAAQISGANFAGAIIAIADLAMTATQSVLDLSVTWITPWIPYVSGSITIHSTSVAQWAVIAQNDEAAEDPELTPGCVVYVAREAMLTLIDEYGNIHGDRYSRDGILRMVNTLNPLLTQEINMIIAQLGWIEGLGDYEGNGSAHASYENLFDGGYYLENAQSWIQWFLNLYSPNE
jgi:hypothetical protein